MTLHLKFDTLTNVCVYLHTPKYRLLSIQFPKTQVPILQQLDDPHHHTLPLPERGGVHVLECNLTDLFYLNS